MTSTKDVLPELSAWNDGRGISPLDYLFCTAQSLATVACIDLFWPKFVEFEGYVLHEGFDENVLRNWEGSEHGHDRGATERAVNFLDVGSLFQNSGEIDSDMLDARIDLLLKTLADVYEAKLRRDFPTRRFRLVLIDDEDDRALTFCQV
jgi:hypothetical protein